MEQATSLVCLFRETTYLYQTAVIQEMGLSEYDRILTKN